jgi:hypothetical protein
MHPPAFRLYISLKLFPRNIWAMLKTHKKIQKLSAIIYFVMKASNKKLTDIPINDGSDKFKQLVRDRLASSYDKSTWLTFEEFKAQMAEHIRQMRKQNAKI